MILAGAYHPSTTPLREQAQRDSLLLSPTALQNPRRSSRNAWRGAPAIWPIHKDARGKERA